MSVYFFDVDDGTYSRDEGGQDIETLDAVKTEAMNFVSDYITNELSIAENVVKIKVIVRNDCGRVVMNVLVDANTEIIT